MYVLFFGGFFALPPPPPEACRTIWTAATDGARDRGKALMKGVIARGRLGRAIEASIWLQDAMESREVWKTNCDAGCMKF